jgi:hypothetical protein
MDRADLRTEDYPWSNETCPWSGKPIGLDVPLHLQQRADEVIE